MSAEPIDTTPEPELTEEDMQRIAAEAFDEVAKYRRAARQQREAQVRADPRTIAFLAEAEAEMVPGKRNQTLFQRACRVLDAGFPFLLDDLRSIADRSGLDRAEVEQAIGSASDPNRRGWPYWWLGMPPLMDEAAILALDDEEPTAKSAQTVEDEVFGYSPITEHIRQAARSRLVSPWSVLGSVLMLVLAETPPNWVIPPIVGADASLNLALALTGPSGMGKSTSHKVSRELLGGTQNLNALRVGPGSGEGLIDTFLRYDKAQQEWVLIDRPQAALYADEVGQVGVVKDGRNGSSFGSIVRSMLTGDECHTTNTKSGNARRQLDENTYRMTMVVGVQPGLSGIILGDEEEGTPQRFLWLPVTDPLVPDEEPDWPGPLKWSLPTPTQTVGRVRIEYPDEPWILPKQNLRARHRGQKAGLDGHLMLTRLKVAAAVALLHGRLAVTEEDWHWSGLLIAVSVSERDACQAVLSKAAADEHRNRGRLDAIREQGRREAQAEGSEQAAALLWRTVAKGANGSHSNMKHESGEGCTRRCLTFALRNRKGIDADEVIAAAVSSDWIEERDGRWHPGTSQPAGEEVPK